jgi:hypothetical protein
VVFEFERCWKTVQEVEDPELSLELGKWWDGSCLSSVLNIYRLGGPFLPKLGRRNPMKPTVPSPSFHTVLIFAWLGVG